MGVGCIRWYGAKGEKNAHRDSFRGVGLIELWKELQRKEQGEGIRWVRTGSDTEGKSGRVYAGFSSPLPCQFTDGSAEALTPFRTRTELTDSLAPVCCAHDVAWECLEERPREGQHTRQSSRQPVYVKAPGAEQEGGGNHGQASHPRGP